MATDTEVNQAGQDQDMVSHQEDPLLTFTEAAELIGKSSSTIRSWVDQGLIAAHRDPSGLRRIRRSEFEKFYGATAIAAAAQKKQSDSIACAKTERSGTRTSTR